MSDNARVPLVAVKSADIRAIRLGDGSVVRTDRCGQKLCGLRPGSEGMPRRVLGSLNPRPVAVPRLGYGARRRQPAESVGPARKILTIAARAAWIRA
jgi:hypothetical protein